MADPITCVLRTEVARRRGYVALWNDPPCPAVTYGHRASRDLPGTVPLHDHTCPKLTAPDARGWDDVCEWCGAPIPWEATVPCDCEPGCTGKPLVSLSSSNSAVYDTEDGTLRPGDMYIMPHHGDPPGWCPGRWTNCDGQHLHVMLPDGTEWDADGRATNCTLPDDTTHRCWVRDGEPPHVTAGKAGHTCTAGAGSIASPGWHGFLRNGQLVLA